MTPESLRARPLFTIVSILLAATLPALAFGDGQSSSCLRSEHRQEAKLQYFIDGDTLVLTDERKVRVLGINAPESRPSPQPKALAATQAAQSLLPANTKLWLYSGIETTDRHGRVLAHVVTQTGTNLAEHLLSNGLAASSAVHPNTRCAEHYLRLEMQARNNKLGLWRESHPWQIIDKRLEKKSSGFRLVTSTVSSIEHDRKHHHLQLENGLRVYMTNQLADEIDANKLIDKRLSVRGWIQWRNSEASVRLHHTSNLQLHSDNVNALD